MIKAIIPAVVFVTAGTVLIVKRAAAARGFSLMMGGTTPPFIMTLVGTLFIALAAATVVLYTQGVLGK